MPWPVETPRELIRPMCEKNRIDPAAVISSGSIGPVQAMDRAVKATRNGI
jgi:hypothetical protein